MRKVNGEGQLVFIGRKTRDKGGICHCLVSPQQLQSLHPSSKSALFPGNSLIQDKNGRPYYLTFIFIQ